MNKIDFDFNKALEQLQAGQGLTGKDGVLTPLIKQLTEAALKAEINQHLEQAASPNRKNGASKKTVKTSVGQFELETPRDREGTFEPQLVKKHQTKLTPEIDQKILGLYALGTSYRDIRFHIEELYGIEVSEATISAVTDQLIPELKAWQSRPLEAIYPFIWLDAIHYKVKDEGRCSGQAKTDTVSLHNSYSTGDMLPLAVCSLSRL